MKKTIILLLIAFGMNAQKITDDQKHFYVGSLISGISGSVAYELGAKSIHASIIGFGLGTLAGIMKESIYDKGMEKGVCDNKDAFTTGWGALFGSLTVVIYTDKRNKKLAKIEEYKLKYEQN